MSTLVWLWLLSSVITLTLFVRGFVRAKITPVTYQFNWSPTSFVTDSLFPKGRALLAGGQSRLNLFAHHLFHIFFHQMKRFHDRVFGKTAQHIEGTPSFFLKTIAEHKDGLSEAEEKERKNGLS